MATSVDNLFWYLIIFFIRTVCLLSNQHTPNTVFVCVLCCPILHFLVKICAYYSIKKTLVLHKLNNNGCRHICFYATHCCKFFVDCNSFTPSSNPMRLVVLLFPFYMWWNKVSLRLNDLSSRSHSDFFFQL